jgi:hypothetical protein
MSTPLDGQLDLGLLASAGVVAGHALDGQHLHLAGAGQVAVLVGHEAEGAAGAAVGGDVDDAGPGVHHGGLRVVQAHVDQGLDGDFAGGVGGYFEDVAVLLATGLGRVLLAGQPGAPGGDAARAVADGAAGADEALGQQAGLGIKGQGCGAAAGQGIPGEIADSGTTGAFVVADQTHQAVLEVKGAHAVGVAGEGTAVGHRVAVADQHVVFEAFGQGQQHFAGILRSGGDQGAKAGDVATELGHAGMGAAQAKRAQAQGATGEGGGFQEGTTIESGHGLSLRK